MVQRLGLAGHKSASYSLLTQPVSVSLHFVLESAGQKGSKSSSNGREQLSKNEQSSASAAPAAPAPKARKLSFKEQRELDGLPDQIAALEAEQKGIHDALLDGSLYASDNARALELSNRSAQIDDELMAALERWEALSGT